MDRGTDMGSARGSRTSWCSSCRTAASSRRRTSRPASGAYPSRVSHGHGSVGEASGSGTAAAAEGCWWAGTGKGGGEGQGRRKWRWRGSGGGGGALFGSYALSAGRCGANWGGVFIAVMKIIMEMGKSFYFFPRTEPSLPRMSDG